MIARNHILYRRYANMKSRCSNKKDKDYPNYGGRGIKVCKRWRGKGGFFRFVFDMGIPESNDLTIERINNDKGYKPSNCKWANRSEQQHNKRMMKNNTSGYKGVFRRLVHGNIRYTAAIQINKKRYWTKYFKTAKEAWLAREETRKRLLC
jgi:hypothetical protein